VLVGFGAPIQGGTDERPVGLARASYSAGELGREINELGLGNGGYPFLVSPEGRFIVHPVDDFVRAGQTLFEAAWERNDTQLHALAIRAIGGENGYLDHIDPMTGQASRILFQQLPEAGWVLGVVFFTAELGNDDERRRSLLHLVVSSVLTALLLIVVLALRLSSGVRATWVAASVGAATVATAIGGIWYAASVHPVAPAGDIAPVVDQSTLGQFMATETIRADDFNLEPPVFLPTGVFLQSIEFNSSTNVEVTGYVWQRYHRELDTDLRRGFVLPEAITFNASEVYSEVVGEYERVAWYFDATLRQSFSYELYPFDRQEVWLRFWHTDFARNVILTPDLDTYDLTNPTTLPGVERDFVLPGWTVTAAGFDYRPKSYNTNFGIPEYVGQNNFPELHFSIKVSRQFLGPFVSTFIPLMVVAAMLFALLVVTSKHEHRSNWFGFKAIDVILGCAALFFVLIFDHAALREELGSSSLMYLETLYFGLYLSILFVTVNAIMFATTGWTLVQFRDNLLPKVLYWPLYTVGLFTVTLLTFY